MRNDDMSKTGHDMSSLPEGDSIEADYRSGFVTVIGRPNVGKSTFVNRVVGAHVTITSSRPNTTRRPIRGVLHRNGAQAVFVDTPGLHRPRTVLGQRLNEHIEDSLDDVDVVVAMLDATAPLGPGDVMVLEQARRALGADKTGLVVAVNKIDAAKADQILEQLSHAHEALGEQADFAEYFPISATSGRGVAELVDKIFSVLPPGHPYFPPDMVSDQSEAFKVAELVREQLLERLRDELPHSVACWVTEWEWPRIRVEIIVERESQKAIVIGKGGTVLKDVGTAVRRQLDPGAYIELHVTVEKHWQQQPDRIERLGY